MKSFGATMTDPMDEERYAAFLARKQEYEDSVCREAQFDMTSDGAALVVRFIDAWENRYSEDRDDPVLGPIIARALGRYQELRRHGFGLASRIARTEAIRSIMQMSP